MLKDCLEVFITALGKTIKNISIGFIRQGAYFIQTNHSVMQLLCDYGDVLALDMGQAFDLKNIKDIVECIDGCEGDPVLLIRKNLIVGGNNMNTKFDSH